jgi:hypothetical protein
MEIIEISMSQLNSRFFSRLKKGFNELSYANDPNDKVLRITAGNFINLMYKIKILNKEQWPTPRVLDEMYTRGYQRNYLPQKLSYGLPKPELLDFEETQKWSILFKLLANKEHLVSK